MVDTPTTALPAPVTDQPPSFFISIITLLLRHGFTILGTWLMQQGLLSAPQSDKLVDAGIGLAVVLAGVLWSALEKHTKIKQITGLMGLLGIEK